MDSERFNYQEGNTGSHNSSGAKSLELPPNLLKYPNQVDGHGTQGNKPGFLFSETGNLVYKPVQKSPKGLHEVSLYQQIFDDSCTGIIVELRKFVPTYIGLFHEVGTQQLFFGMKDLLASFEQPNICDIKLGRRTYTPDSGPEKVEIERGKYLWQDQLGFSINAIKLSGPLDGTPIHLNRMHCRSLTPKNIYADGIYTFLSSADRQQELVSQRAAAFLPQLDDLIDWFERQHLLTFYASSLLLAYDNVPCSNGPLVNGTLTQDEAASSASSSMVRTTVNLIDFTRWRPQPVSGQRDFNVLYGLRRLTDLFRQAAFCPADQ